MSNLDKESLVSAAKEARKHAYAPYSRFAVGAALLAESGKIHLGCNVENLSFGLTICAERSALFQAISQGDRSFRAIAIVADTKNPVSPCGACRQVLAEFSPKILVISSTLDDSAEEWTLDLLLPRAATGILDHE